MHQVWGAFAVAAYGLAALAAVVVVLVTCVVRPAAVDTSAGLDTVRLGADGMCPVAYRLATTDGV